MKLHFWLRKLLPSIQGSSRPSRNLRPGSGSRTRPALEMLEDRITPANFTATNGAALATDVATADSNNDSNNTIILAAGTYSVSPILIANLNAVKVPNKSLTILGPDPTDPSAVTITASGGVNYAFKITGTVNSNNVNSNSVAI